MPLSRKILPHGKAKIQAGAGSSVSSLALDGDTLQLNQSNNQPQRSVDLSSLGGGSIGGTATTGRVAYGTNTNQIGSSPFFIFNTTDKTVELSTNESNKVPLKLKHTESSQSGGSGLSITNHSDTAKLDIVHSNVADTNNIWGYTNIPLQIATNDTARMVITGGGNVGIGTNAASSLLDLEQSGTAANNLDILELTNKGNASSMTNTRTSILFNQWYYNASSPALADAARITVGTEGNWTSTTSTQDSYMAFHTGENGTIAEKLRVTSAGYVGIGDTGPISELSVAGKMSLTSESSTPSQPADGKGYIYSKSDGKLYWRSYDISEVDLTADTVVSPGGSTSQIQYNDGGSFAGSSLFTFTTSLGGALKLTSSTDARPTFTIENTNANANASQLIFNKDSASPAGGDEIGQITFTGKDDGDNDTTYADILVQSASVASPNEVGVIRFRTNGDGSTALTNQLVVSGSKVGIGGVLSPTKQLHVGGDTLITGDLTVQGTTTTIDSTTLSVKDKNIEMGVVTSPSDTTADGGGITLKGATDKTFNWVDSTDSWTSSEHIELASGKSYRINGNNVLNQTTLGSTVVGSSLTSVGTLTALTGGTGDLNWDSGTLFVDSSTDRVGIGTTSPGVALDVQDDTAGTALVSRIYHSEGSDAASSAELRIVGGNASTASLKFGDGAAYRYSLVTDTSDNLLFKATDTNTRMTLDSAGNLGIGTTPTDKLNINTGLGTFDFRDYNLTYTTSLGIRTEAGYLTLATEGANDINLATNGFSNKRLVVKSDGKVGIGTTSPDEELDVRGDIQLKQTGDTAVTVLGDANRTNADAHVAALRGKWNGTAVGTFMVMSGPDTTNKDDGQLTFQTASAGTLAERMRIDETGSVGIGTTSPSYTLDVRGGAMVKNSASHQTLELRGDTNYGAYINYVRNNGSYAFKTGMITNASRYDITNSSGAGGEIASFTTDGKVGINTTSPGATLHVSGNNSYDNTGGIRIGNSSTYASIYMNNSNGGLEIDSPHSMILDSNRHMEFHAGGTTREHRYMYATTQYGFMTTADSNTYWAIGNKSAASAGLLLSGAAGGIRMVPENSIVTVKGKVGIGIDTPTADLHIKNSSDNWAGGLLLQHDDDTTGWNFHANRANNELLIGYNADTSDEDNNDVTAVMVIESDGKVGLGTNGPLQKLDVRGNILINQYTRLATDGGTNGLVISDNSGNAIPVYAKGATFGDGYSPDAAASEIVLYSSTTGSTSATAGKIRFHSRDDAGNMEDFAHIEGIAFDDTATNEDGNIQFAAKSGGSTVGMMELGYDGNSFGMNLFTGSTKTVGLNAINTPDNTNFYLSFGSDTSYSSGGTVEPPKIIRSGNPDPNSGGGDAQLFIQSQDDLVLMSGHYSNNASGNDMVFKTGGTAKQPSTERVRILGSNGNVGIGTSAPSTALHLASATASEPVVTIENTNADGTPPGITFFKNTASPAASDQVGSIKFDSKEATSGDTKTYWEIQSRINDPTNTTPNGQLNFYGLDGDSPGFVHQFQFINSQFSVLGYNSSSGNMEIGPTIAPTGTNGALFKSAGNKMRLQAKSDSSGEIHMMAHYVGIDTTSPNAHLDVAGNARIRGTNKLYFGDSATTEYIYADSSDLRLRSSDKIRIDADDDVVITADDINIEDSSENEWARFDGGIPMLEIDGKLRVKDSNKLGVGDSDDFYLYHDGNSTLRNDTGVFNITQNATSNLVMITNGNSNQLVLEQANGRVGIGTASPSMPLHVVHDDHEVAEFESSHSAGASIKIDATSTGGTHWKLQSTANGSGHGGGKLSIQEAGTNRVAIAGGGNVGIGTASPTGKLNVLSTTEQQRWSYDGTYYANMFVASDGDTQLQAKQGHLSLKTDTGGKRIRLDSKGDVQADLGGSSGTYLFKVVDSSQNWLFTVHDDGLVGLHGSDPAIEIKERSSAPNHTAAFGKLWVKNDAPANLYYTDDAGNDIALTNNGSAAGGGGGGGDVTKVGTPANNQIGVWTGDGTIEGDANFTWDASLLALTGTDGNTRSLYLDPAWAVAGDDQYSMISGSAGLALYGGTFHTDIWSNSANSRRVRFRAQASDGSFDAGSYLDIWPTSVGATGDATANIKGNGPLNISTADTDNLAIHAGHSLQLTYDNELTVYSEADGNARLMMRDASVAAMEFDNSHKIHFKNANSTKMTVDTANGRLGIGTTGPGTKLEVLSSDGFAGYFQGTSSATIASDTTNNHYLRIKNASTTDATTALLGFQLGSGYQGGFVGTEQYDADDANNSYANLVFGTKVAGTSAPLRRMTIEHTGDVGIGTAGPDRELHIHKASTSVGLKLSNDSTGQGSADGFYIDMGATDAEINNKETGKIAFATANSTRMTIDSAGKVGIGTGSPDSKLTVQGDLDVPPGSRFRAGCGASGVHTGVDIYYNTDGSSAHHTDSVIETRSSGGDLVFRNLDHGQGYQFYAEDGSGTENFIMGLDGANQRVGIGATNPSEHFHVQGSSDVQALFESTTGELEIRFKDTSSTQYLVTENSVLSLGAQGSVHADNLNLKAGKAGIGTTSPTAKFHVKDAASSGAFSSLSKQIIEGGDNTYLEISTPADHYGGVLFSDGTSGQGAILYDHTNDILHLKTNATNRLNISSAGNVGIGTGTPAQKLDVVGATQTGDLIVTGSALSVNKTVKNDVFGTYTLTTSYSHYFAFADNQIPQLAVADITCPANPNVGDEYWIACRCKWVSGQITSASTIKIQPNTNQTINNDVTAGNYVTIANMTTTSGSPIFKMVHLFCYSADSWILTVSDDGPKT